jgi:Peptidase family S41
MVSRWGMNTEVLRVLKSTICRFRSKGKVIGFNDRLPGNKRSQMTLTHIAFVRMLALLVVSLFARLAVSDPATDGDQYWQGLARADIEAVHDTIEHAHPGAIDSLNPEFRVWMEDGYHEALGLLTGVYDYNSMLDAVRYYVTGFQDGHLRYSDNARAARTHNGPILVTGWKVEPIDGEFVVTKVWEGFPSELPPVGSRLVQCDGRDPEALYRERIAPFYDRRPFAVDKAEIASMLTFPMLRGKEIKDCDFSASGESVKLKVAYVPEPLMEAFSFMAPTVRRPHRTNDFSFENGVLWVHAANFNLHEEDAKALDAMIVKIRQLKGIRAIVFDTRGNGGGDSSVGGRIFEAATGDLDFDGHGIERLPRVYAQWRVSDVSVASAAEQVQHAKEVYGPESSRVVSDQAFLDELTREHAKGQLWHEQWEKSKWGYRIDREEIIRRHGKLKRFSGKVVLVTDGHCASACLDFADVVRLVPGALHVGKTTSADSVYIDTGWARMPSGNGLIVPLKVWRNRLRGNNEPLVPDVLFDCDMDDDVCVQRATLGVLASARVTIGSGLVRK